MDRNRSWHRCNPYRHRGISLRAIDVHPEPSRYSPVAADQPLRGAPPLREWLFMLIPVAILGYFLIYPDQIPDAANRLGEIVDWARSFFPF